MFSSLSLFSQEKLLVRILCGGILALVGLAAYGIFLMEPFRYENVWYTLSYVIALIASYVTMFFNAYLSKRTPYGTEMLGKIRGFKTFLETAEKERLETLVAENPQYFYDILPYTYVLSVSDVWMKKFESITVEPPNWCRNSGFDAFDMMMFSRFMDTTMTEVTSSMVSTPSSSSGGGFSGGGSGGGGGGSW
jgi:uncharacterized membrane protein